MSKKDNRVSLGWTGNGLLATATSGNGIVAKAATHSTAQLVLRKKQRALRRMLFK